MSKSPLYLDLGLVLLLNAIGILIYLLYKIMMSTLLLVGLRS